MTRGTKMTLSVASAVMLAVGLPVAAYAFQTLQWTANIYTVSSPERSSCGGLDCRPATVSTFDDRGNKCYIVNRGGDNLSISCVKQEQ